MAIRDAVCRTREREKDRKGRRLGRFYRVVKDGGLLLFLPKAGVDPKDLWQDTGVCPKCHRRTVTVARCVMCGWEESDGSA